MNDAVRTELQKTLGSSYTLERELGGGGMSRVFVAEEVALKRKVAVKVLPPELTQGVNIERFNREILVAAQLQHPHIVPVLTAGETNGLPYYTMPFVEGESLRARLARTTSLPITDAIGVLRDVARALAYAHDRGIVHRDIKPDNVLLTGGSATVTDFGIAKAISAARSTARGDTLTQVGMSIGTPVYMSPEQASGDPATDQRTDVYSFGCMAYELLAGRPPFVASSPRRLLAAHMVEKPQPISELRADTPPALADLITRCLEKEADDRPQNASDIVRLLETVTSGGSEPAMPHVLLSGKGMLKRALAVYAAAFVAVAILAKAAIVGIGLPEWVFGGAIIVMALGLPVILWTAYVHRVARKTVTATPTFTPGGSPSLPQGTMATLAIKASPHISWRRTALGGIWALGGFVALIGAYMAMRALGIGPVGSLLASGKLDKRDAIVLADFRTTANTDSSLGRVVSEAVRQGLSESSLLTLKQPAEIGAALARMQRPPTAKLDSSLARDVAVREGVKAILDGEVASVGTGYIVTLRLIRADSGVLLASVNAAGEGSQGLIDAADKAVRLLRGKAGESLRRVNNTAPLAQVTTSSLDALRKYSDAYHANSNEGDYLKAIALARAAVEIDSTFAMAWRLMGVSAGNGGMSPALQDTAFEHAYRLRDRLTTRERLWTSVNYFRSPRHRDRVRSIAAAESALALGTALDSNVFGNYLGLEYRSRREPHRADSMFATGAMSSYASSFNFTNRVIALTDVGDLAKADSVATDALRRFPTNVRAQQRPIEMLYHRGQLDSLSRTLDSVMKSGSPVMKAFASTLRSALDVRSGRIQQKLRGAANADASNPNALRSLLEVNTEAVLHIAMRDSAALAVRSLDAALKARPLQSMVDIERPYFELASSYAMAGRPDKGRELINQFTRDVADTAMRRVVQPRHHTATAHVLLAEKKYAEALVEFRRGDSLPDGPSDACGMCLWHSLARTFDAAGQADSAIDMYNRFLKEPYYERMQVDADGTWLAHAHSRLAQLYEAKRDTANAIAHYEAFVELWKNADPEFLPRVAAARTRIGALRRK